MKTHIYFLTTLVASSLLLKSQTLTQSSHAPIPGDVDSRKGADTTGSLPNSTSGNAVTWNLTGTKAINTNTATYTYSWVNPATLPGTSIFVSAGSNVARSDKYVFLKSSSTKLEHLGYMLPDGSYGFFSNTMEIMHYPFTYGSSYTDNFSGYNYYAAFNGTMSVNGSITSTADGQGTLILPTNPSPTSFSVLRVKVQMSWTVTGTGTLSAFNSTLTSTNYHFYKNGSKFPILVYGYLTNTNFSGTQKQFNMEHDASLVLNVNQLNENNTPYVLVFPNPTTKGITIQSNLSDSYQIEVFNINGQQVFKDKLNSQEYFIDTQFWSNGVYIIQFSDEKNHKTFSSKFIKE
ncbi:MAG: hypothetical protein KatS3mg027_1696 [Bacteroidia bacterium]|nr:MAG: hypothetical protein KatS3mg027_1696 [Bacteroidia bacterium]